MADRLDLIQKQHGTPPRRLQERTRLRSNLLWKSLQFSTNIPLYANCFICLYVS